MVPVKVTEGKKSRVESSGDKGKLENRDHVIAVTDYKHSEQLTLPGFSFPRRNSVGRAALCLALA